MIHPANWYSITDADTVDTPALIIYRDRVVKNINAALSMVNNERLRPHMKTNKCAEAALLMMAAGINKFKCATIAEAEMLAMTGAPDVLLAYQPVGPKLNRFISVVKKYPATKFSCITDSITVAERIDQAAGDAEISIPVYIDINTGMNRSGIDPDGAFTLYKQCSRLKNILVEGLHVYDGHLRNADFEKREADCNASFEKIEQILLQLEDSGIQPAVIAGGSPTFPVHAKRKNTECSPGTFVYWDGNYSQSCREQPFLPAALVLARVISIPAPGLVCIDLGHKSIAAENDLQKRVEFLNAHDMKFVSQSEEHLVAETDHPLQPGDILYGFPYHICPTVALYDHALIAENNSIISEWKTVARDRKITI